MKFQFNKNTVKFFIKDFPLPSDDIELKELRDKYFEELKELETRKEGCKACDKGKLMRKYAALVDKFYPEDPTVIYADS